MLLHWGPGLAKCLSPKFRLALKECLIISQCHLHASSALLKFFSFPVLVKCRDLFFSHRWRLAQSLNCVLALLDACFIVIAPDGWKACLPALLIPSSAKSRQKICVNTLILTCFHSNMLNWTSRLRLCRGTTQWYSIIYLCAVTSLSLVGSVRVFHLWLLLYLLSSFCLLQFGDDFFMGERTCLVL